MVERSDISYLLNFDRFSILFWVWKAVAPKSKGKTSVFVSGEFAPPISFRPTVGAVLMREGEEEDKRLRDTIS